MLQDSTQEDCEATLKARADGLAGQDPYQTEWFQALNSTLTGNDLDVFISFMELMGQRRFDVICLYARNPEAMNE